MKTRLFLAVIAMTCVTFFSCDDDNLNVADKYDSAFQALYPEAEHVRWEKERGYYVADFWRNDMQAEAEAWFNKQANWIMTVTEINYNDVPQEVKDAYQVSDYSRWYLEDTDKVKHHTKGIVYVLEVEKNEVEYDLYFSADGTLIKAIKDKDDDYYNYIK